MAHKAKLAFFGTDEFSDITLRSLIDQGYNIAVVITKPDAHIGRKRILTPPAVKVTAESHNIPVLQPQRAAELVDALQAQCEAGIVVSYGKILPQVILDLFPLGLINIHASLLPKYRGASPIEAALLNGDSVTGVTIMKLDSGMDTGPVYAEAQYEILPADNQATLYDKLARIGADLLIRDLDSILDGTIQAHVQDDLMASNVGMIKKSDGEIDWSQPANKIARQIRAFSKWPGSYTTIAGEDVIITSASEIHGELLAVDLNDQRQKAGVSLEEVWTMQPGIPFKSPLGYLGVSCGENTALVILELKPAGKREMTGKEFLAGHPLS